MTITVQPFCGLWEVIELPGIQPLFRSRDAAITAATLLLKRRPGIIEVRSSVGLIDHIIDLRRHDSTARAA